VVNDVCCRYGPSGKGTEALVGNANCGGDNCHRGAALGALLGAAHGVAAFDPWVQQGLKARAAIESEAEKAVDKLLHTTESASQRHADL